MTEGRPQKLTTFLMFEGRAEEAMTLYTSLFAGSEVLNVTRYGPNEAGAEGSVQHATFSMAGQQFMCSDSYVSHPFSFTPATSIYVQCADDAEIERLYAELSKDGNELMPLDNYGFSTRFAWVNDRFGVSWQLNVA